MASAVGAVRVRLADHCPWCGSHRKPHSRACPMGERYREVQDLGGVPLPRMTEAEISAFFGVPVKRQPRRETPR